MSVYGLYRWQGHPTVSTRRFGRTPSGYLNDLTTGKVSALVILDWETPRAVVITPERYNQLVECEMRALAENASPPASVSSAQ